MVEVGGRSLVMTPGVGGGGASLIMTGVDHTVGKA